MKKYFKLLVAALMAVVMTFSVALIVACGSGDDHTTHPDENNDGLCDIGGEKLTTPGGDDDDDGEDESHFKTSYKFMGLSNNVIGIGQSTAQIELKEDGTAVAVVAGPTKQGGYLLSVQHTGTWENLEDEDCIHVVFNSTKPDEGVETTNGGAFAQLGYLTQRGFYSEPYDEDQGFVLPFSYSVDASSFVGSNYIMEVSWFCYEVDEFFALDGETPYPEDAPGQGGQDEEKTLLFTSDIAKVNNGSMDAEIRFYSDGTLEQVITSIDYTSATGTWTYDNGTLTITDNTGIEVGITIADGVFTIVYGDNTFTLSQSAIKTA